MNVESHRKSVAKYDSENAYKVTLKLNRKTDADIIHVLENCGSKQTFIKALLRESSATAEIEAR